LLVNWLQVSIATHYCFDGWLINIENPVEEANIPNLFMFLEYLKLKLEASLPASKVLLLLSEFI
jgi:endo-beta-N-acetylglucosaminidase D